MRLGAFKLTCLITFAMLLAGCQAPGSTLKSCALHSVPNLTPSPCMLPEWVAFAQQSRMATSNWRKLVLERIPGDTTRAVMVRATVYAWDTSPAKWREAQRLYTVVQPSLGREMQPLVQQWLHDIDLRLKLQQSSAALESAHSTPAAAKASGQHRIDMLERQNAELKQKLDELARIESFMSERH